MVSLTIEVFGDSGMVVVFSSLRGIDSEWLDPGVGCWYGCDTLTQLPSH